MTELNLIGRTVGRFEILSELGRGGMAVVYKARQTSPNRVVALKVLPPELSFDKSYIARFRQEADSAAALEHPHIVPIYAVDEVDGLHYIAMKFIQGPTLKDVIQRDGAMTPQRAAELLSQVGEALDYAHSEGVIHRDIKPSNMMVTDNGWVYLTDFGLARGTSGNAGLTMAGTVMGTPEYMSPEQAQGLPSIGPPTDIYALGVVLYEMLTGALPFNADTPMGMLAARLLEPPKPPRDYRGDLPFPVEDVVMRALARKPNARFGSAREMVQALRDATGVGAPTLVQRPVTPQAGLPPVQPTTPGSGSPYVAVQGQAAHTPQPRPAPPVVPTSQPPYVPPVASQPPYVPPLGPQAAPRKGGVGRGILIGVGVTVLALVLICVGLTVFGSYIGNQALEQAAQERKALLDRGDAALEKAQFSAADDAYTEALVTKADDAAAIARKALVKDLQGRYPEVVQLAQQAVEVAGNSGLDAAVAQALLADGLSSANKYADARTAAEAAQKLDRKLGLAYAAQAMVLAREAYDRNQPELADEGLALIEVARQEAEDDPELLRALSESLIGDAYVAAYDVLGEEQYLDSAAEAYQLARDINEQPLFHVGMGYVEQRRENYAESRDAFNGALQMDAQFALAQLGLGWTDFVDPDASYDETLASLDRAIRMNGDDPWAHFAKGRTLFAKGEYAQSIVALKEADTLLPDNAEVLTWLGRAQQMRTFNSDDTSAEAYNEAVETLRRAIELNDRQKVALTQLGWALQYQTNYDDSLEYFNKALEIDAGQDEAHNGLGWSLFNLERYDEAEVPFRQAVELAPDYANALYGLGQTLEQLDKVDEAKEFYSQALEANPDYQEAIDALARLE